MSKCVQFWVIKIDDLAYKSVRIQFLQFVFAQIWLNIINNAFAQNKLRKIDKSTSIRAHTLIKKFINLFSWPFAQIRFRKINDLATKKNWL